METPPNHSPPPWAAGRAGAATGFIQRVGTDFKGPCSSQTPGLCSSHLLAWPELRDLCRTVEGECRGRAPHPAAPLESLSAHCSGCPGPSAFPPGGYFYITHVFFLHFFFYFCVCGPAVSMRKHPKKCRSALLRVLFDSNRGTVGPGRGTGGFEHAHIVSLKGQAAR